MGKILDKLKHRWGITGTLHVIIILSVFALAGFTTLYVHKQINIWLGINESGSFWLKLTVFIFLILPVYTVILYIWGIILGQRKFFTRFIKFKIGLLVHRKKKDEHT